MCTSFLLTGFNSILARNMDIDFNLDEKVIIIPRNFIISLKKEEDLITNHFAIMGVGTVIDGYPLLCDAMNEKGLSAAALNFKGNARYYKYDTTKFNLAPYELMLYLLCRCSDVDEVKKFLDDINIIDTHFSNQIKNTSLHFMFADKDKSIVVETTVDGMRVYDNVYNVLTNNPPFSYHLENVKHYIHLTTNEINNTFDHKLDIEGYSLGQGAVGLPGDYSSSSRFIKILFVKNNMKYKQDEKDMIHHSFKALDSVSMIDGLVQTSSGYEYTHYQVCYNLSNCKMYYKNYNNDFIQYNLKDFNILDNKLKILELF